MNSQLDTILSAIPATASKTFRIIHRKSSTDASADKIISKGDDRIVVEGADMPDEWYVQIVDRLSAVGVERIELESWGWWIGGNSKPERVQISDHVACHLPNPLTGSVGAARGDAFVSMRGAYSSSKKEEEQAVASAVLWHTLETEELSGREMETARDAGCDVVSASVAGWAICARAAGCNFSATVEIVD